MSAPFVHPTAVVDDGAEIGVDTRVWHFAHVSAGARIGAGCTLGQGVYVAPRARLGDRVKVQNGVSIYDGVELEDHVFVGPCAVFTNVSSPRAFVDRRAEFERTRVRQGASIGANATVVCGREIGAFALVGAGAVVTHDVPAHAVVVGVPARRIAWACRCGERLGAGGAPRCSRCGLSYVVEGERCAEASATDRAGASKHPTRPPPAPDRAVTEAATGERVPFVDLVADNAPHLDGLRAAFERVVAGGRFILGPEVERLEREVAALHDAPYAVGVSSGTDALLVALMALDVGLGDEVILPAYSFFATASCVVRLGARPVFVDVDPVTWNLDPSAVEPRITPKTKAILGVHLFGQPFAEEVVAIAAHHDIPLVEDAAQAIGARGAGGAVGALGAIGCFSFFPTKNLGALGDAGVLTTRSAELAARLRALRSHGATERHVHAALGGNFRLDALQAAFLTAKLGGLEAATTARRENAARYASLFAHAELPAGAVKLPHAVEPGHVWNQYVTRAARRDELREHLRAEGIDTEVYYPTPLHLQPALAALGHRAGDFPVAERAAAEALALPVFPTLGARRQGRIVDAIASFLRSGSG